MIRLGGFQWQRLVQLGPFHWEDLALGRATRVAVGVVVPLAFGWASGHSQDGAFAALGALPAGFASFQGVSRSRIAAVGAASIGMAISTFLGATLATMPWLLLMAVIAYGYATGLTVCLGAGVSIVVLQWAVGLGIAVGLPLPPRQAAWRAVLVLAGGLFQAALVAGTWTFRRGDSERAALAASYRSLADYASGLAAGRFEAPAPVSLPAITSLADPNPLLPSAARLMLLDLLEQSERIRASLAALAAEARKSDARDGDQLSHASAAAATALDFIAVTFEAPRDERAGRLRDLGRRVTELTIATDVAWRWAGEALLGQLRSVVGILGRLDAVSAQPWMRGTEPRAALSGADDTLGTAIATLRANLGTTTEAGRHALRLAVVAGLAEVLVQATSLPSGRWVVLTVFIVLKPDYASTLYRSVHRAAGTALGAVMGIAGAQVGHLAEGWLIVVVGAYLTAAYAFFNVAYIVYSVFLTAFLVVLLDILGIPAIPTAEARLIDTAIGAALAVIAYVAWPTWEGASAPERFARLLEAHREYTLALLGQLARPNRVDLDRLRSLQGAARRARSDAEVSAARLSNEPPHPPLTAEMAGIVTTAVARLAHAELALHALLQVQPGRPAPGHIAGQRLDMLAAAFGTTMSQLGVALRALQPPPWAPPLRPLQAELRNEPSLDPALVGATDGLVDAVDSIEAILRHRLAPPGRLS